MTGDPRKTALYVLNCVDKQRQTLDRVLEAARQVFPITGHCVLLRLLKGFPDKVHFQLQSFHK